MNRGQTQGSAPAAEEDSWPAGSHLAPLREAELPPPPAAAWKLIGPGIVAAGVGLGASEFVLFPYIASQVGLSLLWPAIVVIGMQFFIVMEVERYTLATGETILTGLSRIGRHWGAVFCLMGIATAAWPGWATSAATLLSYLFGGKPAWFSVGLLLAIGAILTLSPFVYRSLERAEFVKVLAVGILFGGSIAFAIPTDVLADAPARMAEVRFPVSELGWPMVLGAMAFAGTGGAAILCQSNWIRDKGFGMGAHAPKIVSPFVGRPVASSGTGWRFRLSDPMLARWRAWWRFANVEQLSTFVVISTVTIVFTSLLAYALLYGRAGLPSDISFLAIEGELLSAHVGSWFGKLFWAVGAISLFATALGVVDLTSRLIADVVRTSYWPGGNESVIYAVVVWAMLAFGITVVASGIAQPLALLVISGSVAGFMMFIYSGLLLVLNTRLPLPLRPTVLRKGVLLAATLLFAALSAATIADQFSII